MQSVIQYPLSQVNFSWIPVLAAGMIHILIFVAGGFGFFSRAEYGMKSGTASVSVELVATYAEASAASQDELPRIEEPERTEYSLPKEKAIKVKPKAEIKPVKTATQKSTMTSNKAQPGISQTPSESGTRQLGASSESASPDFLKNPPPPYPLISKRNGEEGVVLLRVSISGTGLVTGVNLKKSSGFERLDESATRAVKKWHFKPALFGGIPVGDTVDVPIRFKLEEST